MPAISLEDVPLDEAVQRLGRQWGVDISANWSVLATAGVDRQRPVSLRAEYIDLDDALLRVLQVSPEKAELNYTIAKGRITINAPTAGELDVLRIYDVEDLLPGAGKERSPIFGQLFQSVDEGMEQIERIIQETINPDSWRDNGGSAGTVRQIGTKLFIDSTWTNHLAIRRLLSILRMPPELPTADFTAHTSDPDRAITYPLGPPSSVTRSYDLRDWIKRLAAIDTAAYPISSARPQVATADEAEIDDLIETIKENVASKSWTNGNGIRRIGGLLLITQEPKNLQQIEAVLVAVQSEAVESLPAIKRWKTEVQP